MEGGETRAARACRWSMGDVSAGDDEEDYESPEEVDFRGDFKPELVHLLMKLQRRRPGRRGWRAIARAAHARAAPELLEKSVEIDLDS